MRSRRITLLACAALVAVLLPPSPVGAADGVRVSSVTHGAVNCPDFSQDPVFPGSDVTRRCVVINNSPVDATFYLFIAQDSIRVFDENDDEQTGTTDGDTFVSFFSLSLATQRILTASTPSDGESDDLDLLKLPEPFRTTCDRVPLTQLTGDTSNGFEGTHCEIGRVRRADMIPGEGFDERTFEATLHFEDRGDQTSYAGWALAFDVVIRARVPAASDCDGPCPPVYER